MDTVLHITPGVLSWREYSSGRYERTVSRALLLCRVIWKDPERRRTLTHGSRRRSGVPGPRNLQKHRRSISSPDHDQARARMCFEARTLGGMGDVPRGSDENREGS
jgi:hypothetical protein